MQQSYQHNAGYRQPRARKYDTYVPVGNVNTPVYSEPYAPAVQPVTPMYKPAAIKQPTVATTAMPQQMYYQQPVSSLDFVAQSQHQFQVPVKTAVQKQHIVTVSQKKRQPRPIKRSIVHAVVKATVSVDKVTRQSMKAVKHTFEPPELVAVRTRRQKMFHRMFYVVGTASFVLAIGLGAKILFDKSPKIQNSTGVLGMQIATQNDANRQSEVPSETKPSDQDFDTYLVAQPYPRYIRIASIGLEARVRRLGLDSKNAVGSPNNIFDVGWYDGSVRPGEKDGSAVIIGHVSGPSQQGAFWNIAKIELGATIEIEKGNGETIKYKVTKVDKLPTGDVDMQKYIKADTPGLHDLKLITSSGKYAALAPEYSGRIAVTAVEQ